MIERYALLAPLGEGATATVYKAQVRQSGELVALKRLRLRDAAARLLFQHECWTMQRLSHPALVPAFEYQRDEQGDYFTMAIIDGPGLPRGVWEPDAVVRVLGAVCDVLAYLHGQGLVHGDLKPDNLRFDAEGRPRLLDLGFLQPAGRAGKRRGTALYMAPEVIRGEPADPRSDLYALGVMAYGWLTGGPPFSAEDTLGLLQAHLRETPEPLNSGKPEIPAALADAVMACLAKDPGQRPPSAAHLQARLGLGGGSATYLLFGSQMFGRQAEREQLHAQVAAQLRGEAAALVIAGASGLGKSRLLLEAGAVDTAPGARPAVLRAAGRGDVPYQLAVDLLMDAEDLMAERGVAADGADWRALRALMPAWGEAPPPLDSPGHEARLRQALAALLEALTPTAGLVVALDDWDRADAASRALVEGFFAQPAGRGLAWVRTMGQAPDDTCPRLLLGPLGAEAIAELTTTALSEPADQQLISRVTARSEGRPALARELLALWVNEGALARRHGVWALDAAEAERLAGTLADSVRVALAALPATCQRVARAAAVLGPSFSLSALAALESDGLFEALAALEAHDLVARFGDRCQFSGLAHAALVADTLAEEARVWHRRAAALYADAADLAGLTAAARHRLGGGEPGAVPVVLRAARANLEAGALTTAAELLDGALGQDASPPERQDAERLLGDIARTRGEGDKAIGHYDRAIALARSLNDDPALARELVSAGRTAMMVSAEERARALLGEALPLARRLGAQALEARALMTVGRLDFFANQVPAAQAAYEAALALADAADAPVLKSWALGFLGVMSSPRDPRSAAWLHEAIALCRTHQNPVGFIDAANNLGDRLVAAGELAEAETVLAEALTVSQQVGSVHEQAFLLLNLAQTRLELGRLREAEATARKAYAIASALDQPFPAGYGLVFVAQAAFKLGDYAGASTALSESADLAARAKNQYLATVVDLTRVQHALERGEAAEAETQLSALRTTGGDAMTLLKLDWLAGRLATLKGDLDEADRTLTAARSTAAAEGARMREVEVMIAQARRALAGDGDADRALAVRHAEEARELAAAIGAREALAEAHWQLAEAARLGGDTEQAQVHFEAALGLAREVEAPLLEALALVGLGRTRFGAAAGDARSAGEKLLTELARRAATPEFSAWSERHVATRAAGQLGGSPTGLTEALAMWADGQEAASLRELLERLLGRAIALSQAQAGALVGFREQQLDVYALSFLKEEAVFDAPLIDQALWYARPVFEPSRWALPIAENNEVLAVLYLEAPDAGQRELMQHMAEALGRVIGQYRRFQAFELGVERLAFSESLAKAALAAEHLEDFLALGLAEALRLTRAERAMLVRADDVEGGVTRFALDATGRSLPQDTAFSRSVCRHVLESGESVRLLDPQNMEGWQSQQSILALGLQTLIAVPITRATGPWGVLYLDSTDVSHLLGAREQALLEAAAAVLAADRRLAQL